MFFLIFPSASDVTVPQKKFPVLSRDEVDHGKPRFLTVEMNSRKALFDRKNPQK